MAHIRFRLKGRTVWIISPLALHGVNGNRRNWAPARLSGDVGPELHGRTAWRRAAGLWRGPGRNPAHAILGGYRVCGVRDRRKSAAIGTGHRRPASPLVQRQMPNCTRQGKSTSPARKRVHARCEIGESRSGCRETILRRGACGRPLPFQGYRRGRYLVAGEVSRSPPGRRSDAAADG